MYPNIWKACLCCSYGHFWILSERWTASQAEILQEAQISGLCEVIFAAFYPGLPMSTHAPAQSILHAAVKGVSSQQIYPGLSSTVTTLWQHQPFIFSPLWLFLFLSPPINIRVAQFSVVRPPLCQLLLISFCLSHGFEYIFTLLPNLCLWPFLFPCSCKFVLSSV